MGQLLTLVLMFSVAFGALQKEPSSRTGSLTAKEQGKKMTLSKVLEKNTQKWMKISGVVGVGEGKKDGMPCITIFVERDINSIKKQIPVQVQGYNVVFEETGTVRAYTK